MPRPQFSIRTMLWLTLVVAASFGRIEFKAWRELYRLDRFVDGPIER